MLGAYREAIEPLFQQREWEKAQKLLSQFDWHCTTILSLSKKGQTKCRQLLATFEGNKVGQFKSDLHFSIFAHWHLPAKDGREPALVRAIGRCFTDQLLMKSPVVPNFFEQIELDRLGEGLEGGKIWPCVHKLWLKTKEDTYVAAALTLIQGYEKLSLKMLDEGFSSELPYAIVQPLHAAAKVGSLQVTARLLKEKTLDLHPLGSSGKRPLEMALNGNHQEVALLLKEAIEKQGRLGEYKGSLYNLKPSTEL